MPAVSVSINPNRKAAANGEKTKRKTQKVSFGRQCSSSPLSRSCAPRSHTRYHRYQRTPVITPPLTRSRSLSLFFSFLLLYQRTGNLAERPHTRYFVARTPHVFDYWPDDAAIPGVFLLREKNETNRKTLTS